MYQITGGGYGGNADHDGLTNGCSTIGISKTAPVEVMEQKFPVLFRRFALHEGSGGAGEHRGGFGVHYEVEIAARRGARRRSSWITAASARRACLAARTARPTSCASIAAAKRSSPSISPRTRTSRSRPATASR